MDRELEWMVCVLSYFLVPSWGKFIVWIISDWHLISQLINDFTVSWLFRWTVICQELFIFFLFPGFNLFHSPGSFPLGDLLPTGQLRTSPLLWLGFSSVEELFKTIIWYDQQSVFYFYHSLNTEEKLFVDWTLLRDELEICQIGRPES